MSAISRMRVELLLDRLRKDYRQAVNTLIAAGVDERVAHLEALAALDELRRVYLEALAALDELRRVSAKEWMDSEDEA